ncbi:MAG TPA: DUF6438 domain-containing protein [Candidatus Sulfotelmatobacter sp.]|nr:DUF6438 domain-containing protein [Candidatus Sulfotelmatobacter sp.]
MILRFVCALTLTASLVSFARNSPTEDNLVLTLERTACFGSCPVYKLTIRGDGSVTYEGKKYVRVIGTRAGIVDTEKLAELVRAFSEAHYLALEDRYRSKLVSDQPTTYTSLTLHGRHKEVEDYCGAPASLTALERKIDEVANSKKWVFIDAAAVHEEARRGWNVRGIDAQRLFETAAETGDVEVVRAFIEEGASVNAQDRLGDDALAYARRGLAYQEDPERQRLHPEESIKDYEKKFKAILEMLTAAGHAKAADE